MKKILCVIIFTSLFLIFGCSEEGERGNFILYNTGFPFKGNETYYVVTKTEWTGEVPVKIKSIQLIKSDEEPLTYKEDGIGYEVFGADPLKTTGIWPESEIGEIESIENLEIKGEGKIVFKLVLSEEVKEDSERRVKIKYSIDGVEREEIVSWITLQQLTTTIEN